MSHLNKYKLLCWNHLTLTPKLISTKTPEKFSTYLSCIKAVKKKNELSSRVNEPSQKWILFLKGTMPTFTNTSHSAIVYKRAYVYKWTNRCQIKKQQIWADSSKKKFHSPPLRHNSHLQAEESWDLQKLSTQVFSTERSTQQQSLQTEALTVWKTMSKIRFIPIKSIKIPQSIIKLLVHQLLGTGQQIH